MKFKIKHEINGRIRVHLPKKKLTFSQADTVQYYLEQHDNIIEAKVYERTADVTITFVGDRQRVLRLIYDFDFGNVSVPEDVIKNSGRELNAYYKEKLINRCVIRAGKKLFLPASIRAVLTGVKSVKYISKGAASLLRGRLEVSVLDATAIGVSMLRNDFDTAGSVMFMLGIGEILEEWTHKKSVGDLARSMSLGTGKVWVKTENGDILMERSQVQPGDLVIARMGNVIPFDGVVESGEAFVNQASMTGESAAVRKAYGAYAYAGTVIEEGELVIRVKKTGGTTKYEKIVSMIEETEKLKSSSESKAEHLADKLVPYTLAGTALTYLITRNVTKAVAVLMVDYSCALKMAMPVTVLSAIREARDYDITVKGGKYMEAIAEADTIVFDKTGTLTKACPTFNQIIAFDGRDENEMLRMAACLEEHFPHSVAKAVVEEAVRRGLEHEEMHSKVEYIVAHGIASEVEGKKVIIGSHHYIFEDEKAKVKPEDVERFLAVPPEYSQLYMSIDGVLSAVICVEDPIRSEAAAAVLALRELGIKQVVMMTGDSERTAKVIAAKAGVDVYFSEVLPEDKATFIDRARKEGHKVIMVGDGINDSPALSAANVGVAISDGAELAKEIADVTIAANDLHELVVMKRLSNQLMKRINSNYRKIVSFNTALIGLGVLGVIQPTTSALLHNGSTLLITVDSMKDLL